MKGGDSFASVILLDNMQNLNLTTGNVRGSPTKGQSTKLLAYNLQKCQCHEGQGKTEGRRRRGHSLIPACTSPSPAFHMMYSAYKLNKQGDNI